MPDLDQITVNVTDLIPPDNFATITKNGKPGNTYSIEEDNEWRKEVEATTQSGIKGVLKPNTPYDAVNYPYPKPWAQGDSDLYEKYDVNEAGVFPSTKDVNDENITITQTDLDLNEVQIWIKNGVSEKILKELPTNPKVNNALLSFLADPVETDSVAKVINKINEQSLGKDFVGFLPSSLESTGGARSAAFNVALLIRDQNISFDQIKHSILGEDANSTLVLNIYRWMEIKTGSAIDMGAPIYTQTFLAGTVVDPVRTIQLNSIINANSGFIVLAFSNSNTLKKVSSLRFSAQPIPTDGKWCVSYLNSPGETNGWIKNTDTYRFTAPILSTANVLAKKEELPYKIDEIINDLKGDFHKKNVFVKNGIYGSDNAIYEITQKSSSANSGYIGFEFKINQNIHIDAGDKEIARIESPNGDFIKLFLKTMPISQFKTRQILLEKPTDTTSEWNFETEYPIPFYNSQFFTRTSIGGVVTENYWPKRNPREWKPIVGKDAFSLQYKPLVIRNGGKIYVNQTLYEANKNWYLIIQADRLVIKNDDLVKNFEFLFSSYPTTDLLFDAIRKETKTGGQLQDFEFEELSTGVVSNSATVNKKTAKESTELLQCTLKLVDKYPYKGVGANASKIAYDGWKAVVPYSKDDSLHSFEIAKVSGLIHAYAVIDGKPDMTTGRIANAGAILDKGKITLGSATGLQATFKNFESYMGSTGGYQVYTGNLAHTFIASRKNPRIVGIMWHDVIPSSIVGRPTTWADVPKHMRSPFDNVKDATWEGGSVIYYKDYGQFVSDPVLISGNVYEVDTIDGLRIKGTATIVGGVVTQIKATEIVSGTWTTTIFTKLYEGLMIRVGNDVCHSTAFLEQAFELAEKNNYKMIAWKDVLKVLNGSINTHHKYWAPQFDDYALYMFTMPEIRKVFNKRGLPISVAWDLKYAVNDVNTGEIDQAAKDITNQMAIHGHETVIHNHWFYNTSFTSSLLSDEAERAILECMNMARKVGTAMNIWDESANLSTPNSQKLMELLGVDLCISTQNQSTTRATYKMYASRDSFNPSGALSERPLY